MSGDNVLKFPTYRCRWSASQRAELTERTREVVELFNRTFPVEQLAERFNFAKKPVQS